MRMKVKFLCGLGGLGSHVKHRGDEEGKLAACDSS